MFNRNITDDLGAIEDIKEETLQKTILNFPQSISSSKTPLFYSDPERPILPDEHFGDSGTDINGVEFYPFILYVDSPFEDLGAYVMWSNKTKQNYGN